MTQAELDARCSLTGEDVAAVWAAVLTPARLAEVAAYVRWNPGATPDEAATAIGGLWLWEVIGLWNESVRLHTDLTVNGRIDLVDAPAGAVLGGGRREPSAHELWLRSHGLPV